MPSLLGISCTATAETYVLPENGDNVIGQIRTVTARKKDDLLDIARRNGLGYREIKLVNAGVDTWLPGENTLVILPTRFILPDTQREGLVLNIPEMRLYYFPRPRPGAPATVTTYPLGIGREGWTTPYTTTRIVSKEEKPSWYPPLSIRLERAAMGDILPEVVKPGPANPLGDYAMRLAMPGYLIHGTNKPWGVGMRVSHGCIRLYPEDIEALYRDVPVGTPVRIMNQPYKIGRANGVLYLEAHPPLEEDTGTFSSFSHIVRLIVAHTEERSYDIDWSLAEQVMREAKGIPVAIGLELPKVLRAAAQDAKSLAEVNTPGLELKLESKIKPVAERQ